MSSNSPSSSPGRPARTAESSYPGQRLGLPAEGRGAAAGWGRRIAALVVDWFASILVASAFFGSSVMSSHGWEAWAPMMVFLLEGSLLTALAGGSFGQLVTRIAVVHLDGKPVSLLAALARTLLICLVVPPAIYNRDRRGLHDMAVATVTVRR